MPCSTDQDCDCITLRLSGRLEETDYDWIASNVEQAFASHQSPVVLDCGGLDQVTEALAALMGTLRLQARRFGTKLELRNLRPSS
ncbi:hypothetical protein MCP1_170058 [Candidatus Terasakiella magnetica]|nr:hypothetical protein MCP1_170058 [Candidatus Terasakiella magnetica]